MSKPKNPPEWCSDAPVGGWKTSPGGGDDSISSPICFVFMFLGKFGQKLPLVVARHAPNRATPSRTAVMPLRFSSSTVTCKHSVTNNNPPYYPRFVGGPHVVRLANFLRWKKMRTTKLPTYSSAETVRSTVCQLLPIPRIFQTPNHPVFVSGPYHVQLVDYFCFLEFKQYATNNHQQTSYSDTTAIHPR